MKLRHFYLVVFLLIAKNSFSQEILPVYSDYLSDNYYLLHPSMAGASSCTKVRLTARQQWFGQEDAPALQTLSINGAVGERSGLGMIVMNDRNGYHSQKGAKFTYAHHLMFSRDEIDLNRLSFGISAGFSQSVLDETSFMVNHPEYDPVIGNINQKAGYFNMDIGASYNYLEFYAHFTVKNALASDRKLYSEIENRDLKRAIFNAGYTFGDKETIMWEPSVMFQHVFQTKESIADLNVKAYKEVDFGRLWAVLSYRRSLEGAQYLDGSSVASQKLQYVTPIIGINYKDFMLSYTYSHLLGKINFSNGGFHQLTLGLNLFCKPEKYHCNCPAVN